MKGLIAAALAAAVLAGAVPAGDAPNTRTAGPVAGVDVAPRPGDPSVELDSDGLPPRIDYPGDLAYGCDDQDHAVQVQPDTADAQAAAERGCQRLGIAADRLPWPGGVRP